MYHIGRKFPQCNIVNKGWNGVTSEGFYSTAIQVKDWTNVVCVLACYGWNDNGANGSLTGSIPQLTCKDLTTVITDGVTIDDVEIKTAEDYFALFNNDANVANEIFIVFGETATAQSGGKNTQGHSTAGKNTDEGICCLIAAAADKTEQQGKA